MTVRWHGAVINALVDQAVEAGLFEGGQMVGEESDRIAPIEEGTLIRSRTVTIEGDTAAIAYDTPYAARQHEDLTFSHDAGRQAKFLEQSLRVHGPRGMEHVADKVRAVTR